VAHFFVGFQQHGKQEKLVRQHVCGMRNCCQVLARPGKNLIQDQLVTAAQSPLKAR
jgi:hypothetical protein